MSSTTKFITAQVGAKLVTIEIANVDKHGSRSFIADMFGAVGYIKNQGKQYLLSAELREIKKMVFRSGSTISECTKQLFEELRYQNELIDTVQPPADLFDDSQTRSEYDLNQYEHDKANW